MKKFVFLLICFTILFAVKTFSQFFESGNSVSNIIYKYPDAQYTDIFIEMDNSFLPFINERNILLIKNESNESKEYHNPHLKSLGGYYPGDGGCIDNRMILDSTILYYSHQPAIEALKVWSVLYEYNARLNKIEEINYIRDSTLGRMVKENRYVYAYDENDNQTEWADYTWNSQTDEWMGYWRNVYIYNAIRNMGVLMAYSWDSITKNWFNGWPEVNYTFDAKGNLTEKIIYKWISEKNERIEDKRHIYKYDTKSKVVADTCYSLDSITKSWKKDSLFTYIYDSRSNLTGKYVNNWDLNTNKWIPYSRNVYMYEGNSNLKNEIVYDWNSTINTWRGRYCIDYKYDNDWKLTEQIRKRCDLVTCIWSANERYVYSYDDNGNLTLKTRYHWNELIKNWEETEKLVSSWSYPFIKNQSFYVNEKCNDCSFLGSIITGSIYNREKITFHLLSGNSDNLFKIDTVSGDIFVMNPDDLDYDLDSSYSLIIEAYLQDSAACLKQTAEIMIYVNNINDNVPEINDTIFNITEHSDPGTVVGNVRATDDDGDLNPLMYSIISGNENETFLINNSSGTITVNPGKILDYEVQEFYILTIQVSDNVFTDNATITINITDSIETSAVSIKSSSLIKFYPNPATYFLYLEIPDDLKEGFGVELINLAGQVTFSQSGLTEQIDVTQFQTGIYFVKVRAQNNEIIAGKVMINSNH